MDVSSPCRCDNIMCSVEMGVLPDAWAEYNLHRIYYRNIEPLQTNAYPRNTKNADFSRTTTHTPKSLHRYAPLVHAVISISLVSTHSTYSVRNCPKVEFHVFSWNQLEAVW